MKVANLQGILPEILAFLTILAPASTLHKREMDAVIPVCQQSPHWTVEGKDLLTQHKGNVTVVALLAASCPLCLVQAASLELIYYKFLQYGFNELSVVIVNSKDPMSVLLKHQLQNMVNTTPVYQETEEEPVWDILGGNKDDILVFDRCGNLAYFVPFPLSLLSRPYVSSAIYSTYFEKPCGECNIVNDQIQTYKEEVSNMDNHHQSKRAIKPELVNECSGEFCFNLAKLGFIKFPCCGNLEEMALALTYDKCPLSNNNNICKDFKFNDIDHKCCQVPNRKKRASPTESTP